MTLRTGTFDISSLLLVKHQSVVEYGEDTIARVLQADINAHNLVVSDMLGTLAQDTTDRQDLSGTSIGGEFVEIDEYGRVATQKEIPGTPVAYPMRKYGYGVGWTRDWLKQATPADLALRVQQIKKADLKNIRRQIQLSLFHATNYTFVDYLIDRYPLGVKRLANADGAEIPEGPYGEAFDGSTHTHYMARASTLAASDIDAVILNVTEHALTSKVVLVINQSNVAAIDALAGFTPLTGPYVNPGSASDTTVRRLDVTRSDNRLVGYWNGAYEVWTKPWAVANYVLAYDAASAVKPLKRRQRVQPGLRGLRLVADIDLYPLKAEYMEREFGFGVWNRTAAAILYIGGTTWTDPVIN